MTRAAAAAISGIRDARRSEVAAAHAVGRAAGRPSGHQQRGRRPRRPVRAPRPRRDVAAAARPGPAAPRHAVAGAGAAVITQRRRARSRTASAATASSGPPRLERDLRLAAGQPRRLRQAAASRCAAAWHTAGAHVMRRIASGGRSSPSKQRDRHPAGRASRAAVSEKRAPPERRAHLVLPPRREHRLGARGDPAGRAPPGRPPAPKMRHAARVARSQRTS